MSLWDFLLGAGRGYYLPDPLYTSVQEILSISPNLNLAEINLVVHLVFTLIAIGDIIYLILYIKDSRRFIG